MTAKQTITFATFQELLPDSCNHPLKKQLRDKARYYGRKFLLKKQCDGNNGANTVIIVTHNSLFAEIADTVIRVKNGKIESVTANENPKNIDEVKW